MKKRRIGKLPRYLLWGMGRGRWGMGSEIGRKNFKTAANGEWIEIGGEGGIRTPGRVLPFNGFQDRRFRPLSHLSI